MSVIGSNILAGASGAGGGYQISRSVRLRSSASAYFNRSAYPVSGAGTKWTMSMWVKRGNVSTQNDLFSFVSTAGSAQQAGIQFDGNQAIRWWQYVSPSYAFQKITTAVFRDPSAWYHLVFIYDTTLATAEDRLQIWVNGVRQTSFSTNTNPSQNLVTYYNNGTLYPYIGAENRNASSALAPFDGYLTEVNFIDGQALTPSSFGETNPVTGVWQPKKYAGTYGTNGFYLNFSDNSAATAAAIGKDYSGNGNNWTPNNISVTAGVTYDSMLDVPTQWADGGNGRGNYCTGNPLIMYNGGGGAPIVPKNGNLDLIGGAGWAMVGSTIAVSTGKWYWEATFFKPGSGDGTLGIHKTNTSLFQIVGYSGDPNGYGYSASGNKLNNTTGVAYGASYTNGDVIGVALDLDAGTLTFYKNNTSQGTAFSSLSGEFFPAFSSETAYFQANFGQRPFAYTPPSGFKALNTLNLPTPTILKGNQYFDATTYTGTGASLNVVNSGEMQPDFVWTKPRSTAVGHTLFDSLRGVTKYLQSNTTGAEGTAATSLTAFNSNGFTVNSDTSTGANGVTYVGWQWNAGGSTVTNTSGSISAQVRASTTAGFSVVTYTGTGANATVGHGLGVAPRMIIFRARSIVENWPTWHTNLTSAAYVLTLNTTNAQASVPQVMNSTAPTSSVFSVGTSTGSNGSGTTYVAYCFAPIAGYSAFGSYTGNGSTDGTFVFCGFRPRYVLVKRIDSTGDWYLWDTTRNTFNLTGQTLFPDLSAAESSYVAPNPVIDILSNGFKQRGTYPDVNANGGTFIFIAFAENPFKNALAR